MSAGEVQAGVVEKEITIIENEPAHLLCSTTLNNPVWWTVRTILHRDRDRRPIYRHKLLVDTFKQTGRYTVTYNGGVYNLTIINTTVTDAGEYQCIEDQGLGTVSSIFMNVLGKNIELFESLS